MKDDKIYLVHISESISGIEQYTAQGRELFMASTLIQDAVVRNLQTLSESAQRLSQTLKAQHPEIDWRGIGEVRNILVHEYLGVDPNHVWEIIVNDLPSLKRAIEDLLQRS